MKIKNKTALLLILVMIIGIFAGCSSASKDETTSQSETAAISQTTESTSQAESKKVLIAYYSATGTTKGVAEMIASETGGDLFELEPETAYTSADLNYNDKNSRVYKEYENEALRNVKLKNTTPDNFSNYDTVYIGYPIWWGIAAWPVNSFVSENDFTGKTVIPFCTSASSPLGNSESELKKLNQTGTWLDGKRFSSSASQSEVSQWIKELNR